MLNSVGFATPPIPGAPQSAPTPQQPSTSPQPQAPGAGPAAYWTANGASYTTLSEVGQAIAAGRIPTDKNGSVNVQKVALADTATQQAAHKSKAAQYFKNSLVTSFAATFGAVFPPLAMAGMALSTWNGFKAFEEYQASQQAAPPQYMVVEEGRVKGAGAGLSYQAVDDTSLWNVVPSHPFVYKPSVPLDQVR